jgi:hypothetical protein
MLVQQLLQLLQYPLRSLRLRRAVTSRRQYLCSSVPLILCVKRLAEMLIYHPILIDIQYNNGVFRQFVLEKEMTYQLPQSALGRPLDPVNYLTNRLILIISLIVALIAGAYSLYTTGDWWLAAQAGFWGGASCFGAWGISRETDHDNDWSAFLAAAFSVLAYFYFGFPALAAFSLALPLMASRVVSRIVGMPATLPESVVILGITALTLVFDYWPVALVGIAAFVMDAAMSNGTRHQWGFALAALVLLIIRVMMGIGEAGSLSNPYLIIMLVLSIGFALTIISTRKMRVGCDIPSYSLDVKRVRAAMSLSLLTALLVALWGGDAGMIDTLPLWSVLAATILYRLPVTIRESIHRFRGQALEHN